MRAHLAEHFSRFETLVRNGIRRDIYRSTGEAIAPRDPAKPRVLVDGDFGVSFKSPALARRLARKVGARDIWVRTGSTVRWLPWVLRVFFRVPIVATPTIYRSCDILVKLSTVDGMFGPSLEILHCGSTAIVFNVTGFDQYIVDGINARMVDRASPGGVVEALKKLLENASYRDRLKEGALRTAAEWVSWEQSSEQFAGWAQAELQAPAGDATLLGELSAKAWSDYARDEQNRLARTAGIR